jgi:hypothetical protein
VVILHLGLVGKIPGLRDGTKFIARRASFFDRLQGCVSRFWSLRFPITTTLQLCVVQVQVQDDFDVLL